MAWPVDMSLTSGGTSSDPKLKSLPEFDASDALEIVFSKAAACLSSMTGSVRPAFCKKCDAINPAQTTL